MARIRTYDLDTDVSANDYLLGNDGDSSSVVTKRFNINDLKDFIIRGNEIDILTHVPGSLNNGGWVPSVTPDGMDVEKSNIKTVFDRPASLIIDNDDLAQQGSQINIYASNTVGGEATLEFVNFNFGPALDRLSGSSFIARQNGSPDIGGVFGDLIPYNNTDYNVDSADNERWMVNAVIDPGSAVDGNFVQVIELEFTDAFNLKRTSIVGSTEIADLTVTGETQFAGDLTVSNLNFPAAGTGITFGDGVRLSSDATADNLIITGDDDVTFQTNVNVEGRNLNVSSDQAGDQSSLTVTNRYITAIGTDGLATPDIKAVQANQQTNIDGAEPTLRGTLSLIQIGDEYWSLAVEQSADAFILPGLHQDLVGSTADITTGTFFFGDDNGGFGGFQTELTPTGTEAAPALPISTGEFTAETTDDGQREFLTRASQTTPYSQRLFFIPDGTTLQTMDDDGTIDGSPVVGNSVVGPTYLVVSYIEVTVSGTTTGTLTFSELGTGNLIISAPTVSITSLPDAVDTVNPTLLFADDNGVLSKNTVPAIAGQQAVVNFENVQDSTSGSVNGFTFNSGPNCHNVTSFGGRITADLTGRYDIRIQEILPTSIDADKTLNFWELVVLGNVDPAMSYTEAVRTITLPEVELLRAVNEAGSTIKIVNASDIDAMGAGIASDPWIIAPAAGQRIMKLPADETLILNDPTSFELVWSGNINTGWLIVR